MTRLFLRFKFVKTTLKLMKHWDAFIPKEREEIPYLTVRFAKRKNSRHRFFSPVIMLFLGFIIPLILFNSCAQNKYLVEEEIYKTRVYVGKFVDSHPDSKKTQIETEEAIFSIKGDPDIPNGAWCYIRIVRDFRFHPDIRWRMNEQYFTWEGTSDEFRLTKNLYIQ